MYPIVQNKYHLHRCFIHPSKSTIINILYLHRIIICNYCPSLLYHLLGLYSNVVFYSVCYRWNHSSRDNKNSEKHFCVILYDSTSKPVTSPEDDHHQLPTSWLRLGVSGRIWRSCHRSPPEPQHCPQPAIKPSRHCSPDWESETAYSVLWRNHRRLVRLHDIMERVCWCHTDIG